MLSKILVLTLIASIGIAQSTADAGDDFRAARLLIERALDSDAVSSLTVAVARDGVTLWAAGFGWSDRQRRVKATPDTAYMVGSVTKPMTAMAIMLLEERRLIDLDRPANDYLGDAKLKGHIGDASDATVARLLQHTAGLGGHYQVFFSDEDVKPPPMAQTIASYGHLLWPPGESFRYSNLNYGVLGEVIERRSGKSYADFMRDEVFKPLGMRHTCVGLNDRPPGDYATAYGPKYERLPSYRTGHPAAADVWSSANDLVLFGQTQCRTTPEAREAAPAVVSGEAVRRMHERTVAMGKAKYGLGWVITTDAAQRGRIRHGGAGTGVGAELSIVPDAGLVVAVLVNGDTSSAVDGSILPTRVADAILETLLPTPTESRAAKSNDRRPIESRTTEFDALVGIWKGSAETLDGPREVRLWIESPEKIHVRLADQKSTPLRITSFTGNTLAGRFTGDLHDENSSRRPCELELHVCLRGALLCGALTSISTHPTRGGALAYWVALERLDRDSFEK